jgi:methylmalonyl-CoA/ethylmalonyl-CoA epimerase
VHVDGLHQVAQKADDLDESIAFYRDVLGLHLIARFDPPGLVFFDLGGTRLLLEQAAPPALLYLHVDDLDATYAALMEAGVVFEGEPHTIFVDEQGRFGPAGEEERMAFLRDPAGNLIALATRR